MEFLRESRMSQVPESAPATVCVEQELPHDLQEAMGTFLGEHPQWDRMRLLQAAVAGFLFQHGCQDRAVVRLYLDGLFRRGRGVRTTP
jgi:hypothetical protein